MNRLERELGERFGERLCLNWPLAAFTSFRIGGPADLLLTVETEQELCFALEAALRNETPVFCLGAGTNLLVSDRGIRGLVVRLGQGLGGIEIDGCKVAAGAAGELRRLVEVVVNRGLEGLEFAEGIPGTVGGGLVMNAGAFGGEMSRVVTRVRGATRAGEIRVLSPEEVGFAYRRTELPEGFTITRVDFELRPGDPELLRRRMLDFRARRAARQPAAVPNAGSIFKNPPGGFAGRLLEQAGLKGVREGNAMFSEQHANFIVNPGGATAAQVRALMETARERVRTTSGIVLEPEVRLVGEW
jgi:UDP-N-acetylmuramate dehydrogenase